MAKEPESLTKARSFVKSILPAAFCRKRWKLAVWDVMAKPGASSPLDNGFTLQQAWIEASIRLGGAPPPRIRWGGIPLP